MNKSILSTKLYSFKLHDFPRSNNFPRKIIQLNWRINVIDVFIIKKWRHSIIFNWMKIFRLFLYTIYIYIYDYTHHYWRLWIQTTIWKVKQGYNIWISNIHMRFWIAA